ncbi:MAG: restriction endonuclease subunit S [Veillonella sp.]|jgi:type I restriction modification DNA specificity domain protein|uniref:restriction endonuclease subunit S n=1 Tax=Veillonella sp. TaxID=1926307 RepID=UPI002579B92A|nr:restriction endonuclease subunit S [Veillonella sp.]MBS6893138.1 restriction endonuclease subunit S [Veillonella sp.]
MRVMKDSGVRWLGMIPKSWDLDKIVSLYSERSTKVSDKDYPALSVTKQGIVPQLESAAKTDNGDNRKLIKKNDFVINSRSDRRGSCGISEYEGSCSLINIVLAPKNNMVNRYYNYLFKTELFADEFYKWGNGIVDDLWSTKWSNMKNIMVPFPSLEEQQAIAEHLDTKCAEIDTIIAKEQSVIEKLQEYRQSIITEIVTNGLDPTENMVPSGVEWIDSIPLNWKTTRFTKSFEFFKGLNIKKTDLVDSGAGVVSYGQVHAKNNNGYSLQDGLIRYVAENLIDEKSLLQEGDFVFADTSEDLEGVGNSIHIDSSNELYAGYHTLVARCLDKSICTKYFAFLFLTDIWRSQLRKNANGTKVYSVTQKMFKAVSCLVPPIEEQLKIVAYLEQKCDAIDRVISHKLTIINTLAEYKKSLIYEVVTGKKEVPHV